MGDLRLKLLRKTEDGYSIYENPDKELVEKIKAVPIPTEFKYYRFEKPMHVKDDLGGGKLLLMNADNDVISMDIKEVVSLVEDQHLENINKLYKVSDTFNKYFAPYALGSTVIVKMVDDFPMHSMLNVTGREVTFYSGVEWIFNTESAFHWNSNITLERSGQSGHMYFTKDGEIKNRDYNMNFNKEEPYVSKAEHIESFLKFFEKYGSFQNAGNKWFTEEFCFVPYYDEGIRVDMIPFNGKAYKKYREPQIKKPKTAVSVPNEHLIEHLRFMISKFKYDRD